MKKRTGRKLALDADLQHEVKRSIEQTTRIFTYDDVCRDYVKECEIKEFSPHTLRYYDKELGQMRKILIEVGAPLHDISVLSAEDFHAAIAHQKKRGLKVSTIVTRFKALKAVLNWAVRNSYISISPLDGVPLPTTRHKVGTTLTEPQLKRLLDAPDLATFVGIRDYVMLLTFAHTGARLSEIADLKVQNVSFEEDAITFYRTKNGNMRRIPMSKRLNKAMKSWFRVRGLDLETDTLFISQFDSPLDPRSILHRIKAYSRQVGVEKEVPVSAHTFRRTFAKLQIQKGVDVFTVQALMGHSSLDQLKQYVMLYSDDLRKGIDKGFV